MGKLATYEGVFERGHVTLPPDADIPEKTRVYVLVPDTDAKHVPRVYSPRLVNREQAKDFDKLVIVETPDAGL